MTSQDRAIEYGLRLDRALGCVHPGLARLMAEERAAKARVMARHAARRLRARVDALREGECRVDRDR